MPDRDRDYDDGDDVNLTRKDAIVDQCVVAPNWIRWIVHYLSKEANNTYVYKYIYNSNIL